jgi:NAD(P)-dependent dehydrogenase (short-subunit alcohol dehydrogenase family)
VRLASGQVAVVTGGASGIGRGMVDAFAARGLTVVLADVEVSALDAAVAELTESGVTAIGVPVDVRDADQVQELADRVLTDLGRVDVVCNNADVVTARLPVWAQSAEDWRWIVDVNLMGVANGIRAFVPAMVECGRGHVVNTSSIAGLSTIPGGGQGAYSATKHAVVGLSETLRIELDLVAPEVGVTVLCPGPVPSRIHDAARNRPMQPGVPDEVEGLPTPDFALALEPVAASVVGEQVADAVEAGLLYLLPGPGTPEMARSRVDRLLADI